MVLYSYKSYKEKDLILNIVAPGHKKEDFTVELQDNILTVKLEEYSEKFFEIPDYIKADKIEAEYDAGILKIKLPKQKPKSIKIN